MSNKAQQTKSKAGQNPNHIPFGERVINIILSAIIFGYGTYGVLTDDIYIPGRSAGGTHFHGEPTWILYGAFLCTAANLMSVVVDHYDKRNNVKNYKLFARLTQVAAWTLFILALLLDAFVFDKAIK